MFKPVPVALTVSGWSLIELLLVLALLATASVISLPRTSLWQSRQQLWHAQQQLIGYLSQAQQAALFGQQQRLTQAQLAAVIGEHWRLLSNRRWPLIFSAASGRASAASLSLIDASGDLPSRPVARLIISQYGRMRWCLAMDSAC